MSKVVLDLRNTSPVQKHEIALLIYNSMKDNPNFLDPKPTLAAFKAKMDKMNAKMEKLAIAKQALKIALIEQRKASDELANTLRQMSWYVAVASNGDMLKALSSGMKWRKAKTASPVPPVLQNLRARATNKSGEIILLWKGIARRYNIFSYEIRYTFSSSEHAKWVQGDSTSDPKLVFQSPRPGVKIWFQVRATNATGAGPWSNRIGIVSHEEE
ncbi:MAG: fibronectin type III domain-containing protein [Bacteroidetes bacterium]|nr:fibronectin type III domain-containing protein [Bacteroidota bacterium]